MRFTKKNMFLNKIKPIAKPLMGFSVTSNTQYFICWLKMLQLLIWLCNTNTFNLNVEKW